MMISAESLSEVFVDVAETLVAPFDLVEFLNTLAGRIATVSDADAAGILLADRDGRLRFMASSTERAMLLELFQLQHREGPCLDCYHSGASVIADELERERSRWPQFAPRALEAGFRSVHALPMRLQTQTLGALNVFTNEHNALSDTDHRIIQALADVATIGILQERAIDRAETLNEQLQHALNSRIVIEQAKGAIAHAHGVRVEAAFAMLREYARRQQLKLSDVARTVIADPAVITILLKRTDS